MTTKEYNEWRAIAELGLCPDEENPLFLFNGTHKDILMDIVNGKIDPVEMAKIQMRNRGLDLKTGKWIGWKQGVTSK